MKRKVFNLLQLIIGIVLFWQIYSTGIASAQTQTNDRLLGIVIMASGNSIKVKGYCIYVKDGKEIREELEKENAWGWNFRGDYIKEVKMQKISGDASFQLIIMEGEDAESGKPVFESDWINSTELVIYKRNQESKSQTH